MKLTHGTLLIVAAIAMLTYAFASSSDGASDQESAAYINEVTYLGVTRSDSDSVDKKIIQAPSIAKSQEGRLYLTDTAIEFSAKRVGRYVTAVVFGRGDGARASFLKDNRVLKVEANDQAWIFFREKGFDSKDRAGILNLFEMRIESRPASR